MTKKLFLLFLLLWVSKVEGSGLNTVINPISINEIEDSTVKHETMCVVSKKTDGYLQKHKVKNIENLVMTTYKGGNWMFYISISDNVHNSTESEMQYHINNQNYNGLIGDIRFYHMKYMYLIGHAVLENINSEILRVFSGKLVKCKILSYSSKDRTRHYLHLHIGNDETESNYIFIIKDSELYKCVLAKG